MKTRLATEETKRNRAAVRECKRPVWRNPVGARYSLYVWRDFKRFPIQYAAAEKSTMTAR